MVGASAFGAGQRWRVVPIALALGAAGFGGYLFAQWAARRPAEAPRQADAPSATVASAPAPPASVAPRTIPPATYAAPHLPLAQPPATAPARSAAPGVAAPAGAAAPAREAAPPPPPAPLVPETVYTLQAVTQQDGVPVAIVNGQLVRVGDEVEGARVLRIEPESVELEKGGRRIVVGF